MNQLSVSFDKDTFSELMFEYSEFEDFSALKINYDKTEIMRIGSIRKTKAMFYSCLPLIWSDGPIRVLGIDVCTSWQETIEVNYTNMINKITDTFNIWSARNLSPLGKIQIVNSLANSQFIYKLQVLPAPSANFMKVYKQLVSKFIWDDKVPKISYDRLLAGYTNGGLQLRDLNLINQTAKLVKIAELFDEQHGEFWHETMTFQWQVSNQYLFECNMSCKDVQELIPVSFIKDMLYAWALQNYHLPSTIRDILNQNLWYNSHTKQGKKWVFNEKMYKEGITKIMHIFDLDTGRFYDFQTLNRYHPNVTDYLTYYALLSMIPREWKTLLMQNAPDPVDNAEK